MEEDQWDSFVNELYAIEAVCFDKFQVTSPQVEQLSDLQNFKPSYSDIVSFKLSITLEVPEAGADVIISSRETPETKHRSTANTCESITPQKPNRELASSETLCVHHLPQLAIIFVYRVGQSEDGQYEIIVTSNWLCDLIRQALTQKVETVFFEVGGGAGGVLEVVQWVEEYGLQFLSLSTLPSNELSSLSTSSTQTTPTKQPSSHVQRPKILLRVPSMYFTDDKCDEVQSNQNGSPTDAIHPPHPSSPSVDHTPTSTSPHQELAEPSLKGKTHTRPAPSPRSGGAWENREAEGSSRTATDHELVAWFRCMIRDYSRAHQAQYHARSLHECAICFDMKYGSEFVTNPFCSHHCCKECYISLIDVHLHSGSVADIKCVECGAEIHPSIVARLTTPENYAKYEQRMLQKALEAMPDSCYCPKCSTICLKEDECARCSSCRYVFCTKCTLPYHPGTECPSFAERIRQEVRKLSAEDRAKQHEDIIRKLRALEEEQKSEKTVKESSKACPKCQMRITKASGCNKVVCSNCGTAMCYTCGKDISDVGYDHFEKCALYDADQIAMMAQDWGEDAVQHLIVFRGAGAPRARQRGVREGDDGDVIAQRCPWCGHAELREGNNNHVRCRACRKHFCWQCGVQLGKGVQHFGPGLCQQHSA